MHSVVDGGQHEDGELGLDLERLGNEVDAACPRHADVGKHERDFVQTELLQRLVGRAGRIHLELLLLEKLPQRIPDRLFVIDHEDRDDTRMSSQRGSLGKPVAKLGIGGNERQVHMSGEQARCSRTVKKLGNGAPALGPVIHGVGVNVHPHEFVSPRGVEPAAESLRMP